LEKKLHGIPASPGIAIGPAYIYHRLGFTITRRVLTSEEIPLEIQRYQNAIEKTKSQIFELEKKVKEQMDAEHASIFKAHQVVLEDPVFTEGIPKSIQKRCLNAEFLIHEELSQFKKVLSTIGNDFFKERISDIEDVGEKIIENLGSWERDQLQKLNREVVLLAIDLSPTDTVNLPTDVVQGFATDIGGRTSHVTIVARSLGLPAVVGVTGLTETVQTGDMIILDGNKGIVIINPSPQSLKNYQIVQEHFRNFQQSLEDVKALETKTLDGHYIRLAANIELPTETDDVFLHGAEEVGLFRTEFLFLNREEIPSEEEQFESYKELALKIGQGQAIVRTLDLGGDKFLDHLNPYKELNPFLGLRAIRLCLKDIEIFKKQIRAILRAAVYGHLKLMFPMISSVNELIESKKYIRICMEELQAENTPFKNDIELGAMIEVPSAALLADILIQEVDFFSIGTNDLIQYTLAVDRINEEVAYLYDPLNPAILRLIKMTIDAAHNNGKWVGMCGEMAGEPKFIPLLLGLGLDELSCSMTVIPVIKTVIRMISMDQSKFIAQEALKMRTSQEVSQLIHDNISNELKSFLF
jgi:phosphotransferase system enzyme I (PtsI)